MSGDTVFGYLPVEFFLVSDGTPGTEGDRVDRIRMLQTAMDVLMRLLLDCAVEGFPCVDGDGVASRCHFVSNVYSGHPGVDKFIICSYWEHEQAELCAMLCH